CFSTRDVLYYIAVDAFGFHQSYSLVHIAKLWKRSQLNNVIFFILKSSVLWMCVMNGFYTSHHFDTIDTLHTRAAYLPRTVTYLSIASTDPHRTNRIIGNAYMRCVPMKSYGMRTMRESFKVRYFNARTVTISKYKKREKKECITTFAYNISYFMNISTIKTLFLANEAKRLHFYSRYKIGYKIIPSNLGSFSNKDVLCLVAVIAFDFHQLYSLEHIA
ncbi:hypothetical protein SFRURICE_018496, partial [Spodoptera frugiperda]